MGHSEVRRRNKPIPPWLNSTGNHNYHCRDRTGDVPHIHDFDLIPGSFKRFAVLIDECGRPQTSHFSCHHRSLRSDEDDSKCRASFPDDLSLEIIEDEEYGVKGNVFAFGFILFELIIGPQTFRGRPSQIQRDIGITFPI
jgi:hypothetical protein